MSSKDKLRKKFLEKQYNENKKIIEDYQKHTGHSKPSTRREFLGSGLLAFSAAMYGPSILGMNRAFAADCPTSDAASRLAPFINLNLSGGAAISGNFVPLDAGGQPLPSYSQMGLGATPTLQTAFANNARLNNNASPAANFDGSGILAGIRSVASADTISKTASILVCSASGDDTGNNRMNIAGLVTLAGLNGEKIAVTGSSDTESGVRQLAAFSKRPPAPLRVSSINDLLGAVGYEGALAGLNQAQQVSLATMVKNLSDSQARNLSSLSGGENFSNVIECSMDKNINNIKAGAGDIDPRGNADLSAIWNFGNRTDQAFGGMVANALTGLAGAAGLDIGGYDYHGQNRATTDGRDFNAGVVVGKILQSAAVLNEKVFIHITSDGSVRSENSNNGGTNFTGDSGQRGAHVFLMFDPAGAPQTSTSQLGFYTSGQGNSRDTLVGGSVEAAAAAVFANWAKFSGDMGLVDKVLPGIFTPQDLNEILVL